MKPRKQTILIMIVGLLLFAFAAVMAQTPAPGDQKKPAEACCAMESCCDGDSCEIGGVDGRGGILGHTVWSLGPAGKHPSTADDRPGRR